jgi:hypothetical protein
MCHHRVALCVVVPTTPSTSAIGMYIVAREPISAAPVYVALLGQHVIAATKARSNGRMCLFPHTVARYHLD